MLEVQGRVTRVDPRLGRVRLRPVAGRPGGAGRLRLLPRPRAHRGLGGPRPRARPRHRAVRAVPGHQRRGRTAGPGGAVRVAADLRQLDLHLGTLAGHHRHDAVARVAPPRRVPAAAGRDDGLGCPGPGGVHELSRRPAAARRPRAGRHGHRAVRGLPRPAAAGLRQPVRRDAQPALGMGPAGGHGDLLGGLHGRPEGGRVRDARADGVRRGRHGQPLHRRRGRGRGARAGGARGRAVAGATAGTRGAWSECPSWPSPTAPATRWPGLHAANELGVDVIECDVHEHRGRLEVGTSRRPVRCPCSGTAGSWRRRRRRGWASTSCSGPTSTAPPSCSTSRGVVRRRPARWPRFLHHGGHHAPVLVCGRWWPSVETVAELPFVRPVLSARTRGELTRLRRRLEVGPPVHGVSVHRSLLDAAVVAGCSTGTWSW